MNRLLVVAAIFLAAVVSPQTKATPTPAPASTGGSGGKPFLSAVSKTIDPAPPAPTPIKFISQYASPSPTPAPAPTATPVKPQIKFRPTKDGIEEPFYDVPWAVHIPVEVPFEGGTARITWQARVSWENPPDEWYDHTWSLARCGAGIYRMDGKPLEQNAIRRGGYAFRLEKDAPLPSYVWSETGSGSSFTGEKDKHKPMAGLEDDALVIDPVLPGWYAMWFAFQTPGLWPQKEPKREFLQGTIHFDCIVSRGKDELTTAEKEYLFKRGKRPDKMQDDKFYKVTTIDIPFKLRRDSWEFDHMEVIRTPDDKGKMVEQKRVGAGGKGNNRYYSKYTVSEKVSGKEVELNLTEKIQDYPRGEPTDAQIPDDDSRFDTVYIWDEKWKASFPPSLPDYSFGKIEFSGDREGKYQQKGQYGTKLEGTYSYWAPDGPSMFLIPEYPAELWIHTVRDPRSRSEKVDPQAAEKGERDYVANKYGKDALEWFVPDYFEDYKFAGVKKGESPAQYVIQAERPRLKDAAPLELGAYPLVRFTIGPWEICGYYKRLSEIENRVVASKIEPGEATIVSDEDDFWKWYPQLCAVIAVQKVRADKAVADAALETVPMRELLKSQKRLLFSMSGNESSFSPDQLTKMHNKVGEITESIRHARERITDNTADARDAYQKINDKLEEGNRNFGGPAHGELFVWRQHYRKIFERIAFDIAITSGDPEILKRALEEAKTEAHAGNTRILEAQLYMALGNSIGALDALRSAVNATKNAGNKAAKSGDDETVATQMLRDLECAFLRNAIDKSQGTIKAARQAFYGYMLERGFAEYHQLHDTTVKSREGKVLDMPLAHALAATEYALSGVAEDAWALVTTGLFGSMSAIAGKPAAEAELLETVEKRMTTAFIGLNTMLRLRGQGYTFEEIQKMTSIQIRDALPLRNLRGELLSDQDAALQRVAIREAMNLPDIQALTSGDRIGLQLGLEKKYWDPRDVGDTWLEWIGDATSMYNLFLMLPGAKAGTVGRLSVFWDEAELKTLEALEKSGEVISGTEAIANTIGVTQFLGAAGATDTGKAVLGYIKALGRYEESLKWYDKVIWTSGKLTGMLTINFTTVLATEKLFGHKAAMLMQAALMFGSDPETLVKLLDAQNIPRQKVAELIINEYLPATQVHIKRLAQISKNEMELEQLFARVKVGQKIKPEEYGFLEKYFEKDWRRLIPNGQASHDSTIALGAAAEGAKNGVDNGAGKAVGTGLKPALDAELGQANKAAQEGQHLANQLQGGQPPVRGPPPPAAPPTPPRDLQRVLAVTRRDPTEMFNLPRPPAPPVRSETAKAERLLEAGEQAIKAGNLDEAKKKFVEAQGKYEEVLDLILKGQLQEADELPLEWLHMKRCLAYELQDVTRKFPTTRLAINNPIPLAEAEKIFSDRASWVARSKAQSGALSEVFDVAGNDEYFVREVKAQFDYVHPDGTVEKKVIDVANDVRCNLVHTELARAMGFDMPTMEVRVVYNAKGEAESAVYVMRKVKGKRLSDLKAAEIYLYREELSRHRALAVLIGDYDRKLDNYLVTEEGHLVPIDAGVGDVTGERWIAAGYEIDEPSTFGGINGRDHWYSRFYKDEAGPLRKNAPYVELWEPKEEFARKNMLAEQALTYNAAKPAVDEINHIVIDGLPAKANGKTLDTILDDAWTKVLANEGDIQRFLKRAAQEGMVDLNDAAAVAQFRERALNLLKGRAREAAQKSKTLLKARAPKIDDCMQGLNERSGRAKPGGGGQARLRLPADELFQKVVFLHILNQAVLRRAAA